MEMTVSVIVPTHNRPDSLRRTIDTILAQQRPADELILVNDGQIEVPQDIFDSCEQAGLKTTYIRRTEPSVAGSRNAAMRKSSSDIMIMMEDDCDMPPDYIALALEVFNADTEGVVAGFGPYLYEPDRQASRKKAWDVLAAALGTARWRPRHCAARYVSLPNKLRGRLSPIGQLPAGGLCLRAKVIEELSFDENMKGYALVEDREFTFRISRQFPLFYFPEVTIVHHRDPGGGRGDMKRRGRIYFANSLYSCLSGTERGAGTIMMLVWDFAGTMSLFVASLILGRQKRNSLDFLIGMWDEIWKLVKRTARRELCE